MERKIFDSDASRLKSELGFGYFDWWLRSASNEHDVCVNSVSGYGGVRSINVYSGLGAVFACTI